MSYLVQPFDGPIPAPLAYVGNHVDRALATLSARFADPELSPNLHALIRAEVEQLQSLEDVAQAWLYMQSVDGAQGIYLDWWGLQVGQGRGSDDDATYRLKLRAAAARNRSDGSVNDIALVLSLLLGTLCTQVRIVPLYPAAITINLSCTVALTSAQEQAVIDFSMASVAAGVRIDGIAICTDPVFAFDGYPSPPGAGYDVGAWASYIYLG